MLKIFSLHIRAFIPLLALLVITSCQSGPVTPGQAQISATPNPNRKVLVKLNVKAGDRFRYQSTFTQTSKDGKSSTRQNVGTLVIQKVSEGKVFYQYENDPNQVSVVVDATGNFVEVERDGKPARELLTEGFDQTSSVVFSPKPVGIGDAWEIEVGYPKVKVRYEVRMLGPMQGKDLIEIHSTPKGYEGPVKFLVDLSTGMMIRAEFVFYNEPLGMRTRNLIELIP